MGKQTKRPPKGQKPATKTLRQQLERRGLFKDDLMRLEETESPKLSAALLDMLAPYTHATATRAGFEQLATLAVLAWNAALLDEVERRAFMATALEAVVEAVGEQERVPLAATLAALLERKLSLFDADRRFVVDYRVTETATQFGLAVAAMAKR